jgi:hypothetical protein
MRWFKKRAPDASAPSPRGSSDSNSGGSQDRIRKNPAARQTSRLSRNSDDANILKETDCTDKLGFAYPNAKKWLIITVIFLVQTSMNFNASVYGNAVHPMMDKFNVSAQMGRIGQMAFLIAYAFGCELWAPWSEELGRWKVLQCSLGLVNLWQVPCALLSM